MKKHSNLVSNKKESHLSEAKSDINKTLYVIYGSRTGNSGSAAQLASNYAKHLGLTTCLLDMKTMDVTVINKIKHLLLAVSTHGEGDPPAVAQRFYNYLHQEHINHLRGLKYSILALGDSSYKDYCKTGKDFEKRLKELGAESLFPLVKCDVDYEEDACKWVESAVEAFYKLSPKTKKTHDKVFSFDLQSGSLNGGMFQVAVKEKRQLSSKSSTKKTLHIALSSGNAKLNYQAGDTLGIRCTNSRLLVDRLLKKIGFDGTHVIRENGDIRMLKQVLLTDYELTLLTPVVLDKYAVFTKNPEFQKLITDSINIESYCENRDVLDLITEYPAEITPEDFLGVLRKLKARLYSVASSSLQYPNEVHLTLGVKEYTLLNRPHIGVASSFLADRTDEGEKVSIYLEENISFRLPIDKNTPIIMIVNGTGISAYRSFLQERVATEAKGENWLIFGERNSKSDFLYEEEIMDYMNKGVLTRLDTAFSRDQDEKIYVQHKMHEHRHDLVDWVQNRNAVVYLCGNKRNMAKAVRKAMQDILCSEAKLSTKEAIAYMAEMKAKKRWQEDVY